MASVGRVIGVPPGEGRVATRLLALMFVAWFGFAIGGNAVEGLLLARVGPDVLPYLFVALGVVTATVVLGMNAALTRRRPYSLLLFALPVMAGAVLVMRVFLTLERSWAYLASWLAMMVLWTAAIIVTWGIAGAAHDTRQAKRLFPLYASGVILGVALGGLATAPLARWLEVPDLLLVWAAALVAAFLLARSVLRLSGAVRAGRSRPAPHTGRARAIEGLLTVRASPLLSWMSLSLALFALLYFTLTLLFARAATARFPNPQDLAGFLGVFMGATSGIALLASLFGANRLGARFGVATTVLVLPLIYAGGFSVLAAAGTTASLFAFRFVQMVWMHGVWVSAWQALYNVVPPERRDGARAFVEGVALQAGVTCAGAVLVLADGVLEPRLVAVIAFVLAAVACMTTYRLRGAYAGAVVEALRAGNPDVFLVEERPFAGVGRDAAALSVAVRGAQDSDPAVRRISVEVLAEVGRSDARPALVHALTDDDAPVRRAALRGLLQLGRRGAVDKAESDAVTRLLADVDSGVRTAAVELVAATDHPSGTEALRPLLDDRDPRVRARASARLLRMEARANETLADMTASEDPDWRAEAIAAWGETDDGIAAAAVALGDADPLVRRAAVSALAGHDADGAVGALVGALGDADSSIRTEAVDGLVRTGRASLGPLMDATRRPELESEAMRALVRLDAIARPVLDDYVARKVSLAIRYSDFLAAAAGHPEPRMELLAHSLRHAARRHAVDALYLASRTWGSRTIEVVDAALDNLQASDPAQRANALETLEALGERSVVRPLLAVWEREGSRPADEVNMLAELLLDADPWVRACAIFARPDHPQLRAAIEALAASDPDTLVRNAAETAVRGKVGVDKLSSLSLIERVVFLRGVPLFANLSPADLKHVAEIATEHAFPDGATVAQQGEPGDEMHVVVSGGIRVLVDRDATAVEVARRAPGECVGEMAVVSRSPRMASLVAQGEVRTLAIDQRRFERILRERPEASLAVMRVLCDRLRQLHGGEPLEARS
jgi:HEAT repeat protein